ncbi:unnamed protein product [Musa textilis]
MGMLNIKIYSQKGRRMKLLVCSSAESNIGCDQASASCL